MVQRSKKLLFVSLFAVGCASTNASDISKAGLAVLDFKVDAVAEEYSLQKQARMDMCDQMDLQSKQEAIDCMGPYHGDKLQQKIEQIVKAQEAVIQAIETLEEIQEVLGKAQ